MTDDCLTEVAGKANAEQWRFALALLEERQRNPWADRSDRVFVSWAREQLGATAEAVRRMLATARVASASGKADAWMRCPYWRAEWVVRRAVEPGLMGADAALELIADPGLSPAMLRQMLEVPAITRQWRTIAVPIDVAAEWSRACNRARFLAGKPNATDEEQVRAIVAAYLAATEPILAARSAVPSVDIDAGTARCAGCLSEDFAVLQPIRDGSLWCDLCLSSVRRRRRGRSDSQRRG